MANTVAGILIEIFVSDLLVVVGLTGQKLCVMQADVVERTHEQSCPTTNTNKFTRILRKVVSNWRWLLAVAIFLIGQLAELIAIGLTTQTKVAAASTLGLFWSTLASIFVFKENFQLKPKYKGSYFWYQWDLLSLLTLVFGATIAVFCAPPKPGDNPSIDNNQTITADEYIDNWMKQPFVTVALLVFLCVLICAGFVYKNWGRDDIGNSNAVLLACVSGWLASYTFTLSSTVVSLVETSLTEANQYNKLSAWVMTISWVVMLIVSFVTLNVALSKFEQGIIYPIYSVMSTTTTIVFGLLYYHTYDKFVRHTAIGFVFGISVMLIGVCLTSLREHKTTRELESKLLTQLDYIEHLVHSEDATDGLNQTLLPTDDSLVN